MPQRAVLQTGGGVGTVVGGGNVVVGAALGVSGARACGAGVSFFAQERRARGTSRPATANRRHAGLVT
jgi:hypothetical protein